MFNYLDVGGGPRRAYMCQKFIKLCTLKISNGPGDSKHMAGGGAGFLPVGVGGYRSVKGEGRKDPCGNGSELKTSA